MQASWQAGRQADRTADVCRAATPGSLRRAKATYVNELNVVSLLEVMQDRSVIKICQVGHVLAFFILGGVYLRNLILLEVLVLMGEKEQHTRLESSLEVI
jgi:hypothetical protein